MKSKLWTLVTFALLVSILAACTPAATPTPVPPTAVPPTAAPTKAPAAPTNAPMAPTAAPTSAPMAPTAVPPTAAPAGPKVGGTVISVQTIDPPTLDCQTGAGGFLGHNILRMINGSLVAMDPNSGAIVPDLAESWSISPDGLAYTFKLKKNVKFHNGDSLTAKDWAYTFKRAIDPAAKATRAANNWAVVTTTLAVDDFTFQVNLKAANAAFLFGLLEGGWCPVSQKAVEAGGANYGRAPVGTGPYKFKEWVAGQKVVLERNPDYNWGPAFVHQGPAYIQTIEYRIIPEEATHLAATEAGQIDVNVNIPFNAVPRFSDKAKFQLYQGLQTGIGSALMYNVSKAPFNDLKVRQALNYAVDKTSLIKVVTGGSAMAQYGGLSPVDIGYWAGVEQYAPKYDLAKAKSLLAEAGYTAGSDGILQKGGQKLAFPIWVQAATGSANVKTAEVLKEQLKAVGIDVTIKQVESGVFTNSVYLGKDGSYEAAVIGGTFGDADFLFRFFSDQTGIKLTGNTDSKLVELLTAIRTTVDPAKRQDAAVAAQKYLIDQAYEVPIYVDTRYVAISAKIKGVVLAKVGEPLYGWYLNDAYIP